MNPEQKIDKILDNITDIKIELAKYLVHQEEHKIKLLKHEEAIKLIEEYRNKIIGKTAILSILISTLFGLFGAWILKHF